MEDNNNNNTPPIASTSTLPLSQPPIPTATAASSRPARKRRPTIQVDNSPPPDSIHNNNSSNRRGNKSKLKLKINANGNSNGASGTGDNNNNNNNNSKNRSDPNQVGWDRELDSDPEEPLAVEEHFILRVPPSLAPLLHEAVTKREVLDTTWFKFKDSRRAIFHHGKSLFGAKLVDLPTLIESQKMTGVGGHSIKVADISQMLIVDEGEIEDEESVTRDEGRAFNIEDYIFPHGITPPLKHVRKRRFRKRVNKRTIEIVEDAVEKLLEADATCEESKYELIDQDINSEDEYNSDPPPLSRHQQQQQGGEEEESDKKSKGKKKNSKGRRPSNVSDLQEGGRSLSVGGGVVGEGEEDDGGGLFGDDGDDQDGEGEDDDGEGEGEGDEEEDEEEEGEGSGYDSDLANEINRGMQALDEASSATDNSASEDENGNPKPKSKSKKEVGSDDSDVDGLFGGSSDEDDDEEEEEDTGRDDPETLEERRRLKLLGEEVGDLERAISVKEADMAKATNPIFKKRFEEVIKKLSIDRDAKKTQKSSAIRELEKKKEATEAAVEALKLATLAPAPTPTATTSAVVGGVVPSAIITNPTPAKEGVADTGGDIMDVD